MAAASPKRERAKRRQTRKPKPAEQPNIWAIPPLATTGPRSPDTVYAAVGYALSNWELFETGLALLFMRIAAIGGVSAPALRAYGAIRTFEGRCLMIQAAADQLFLILTTDDEATRNEIDNIQKQLRQFLNTVRQKASPRRNDIAHGIVRDTEPMGKGNRLSPPDYQTGKIRVLYDSEPRRRADIRPEYLYSTKDIRKFGNQFAALTEQTDALVKMIRNITGNLLPHTSP